MAGGSKSDATELIQDGGHEPTKAVTSHLPNNLIL
jgi:hypothetical protein